MKVLITGAGGFIGSHVAELFLREGHDVRALARYNGRSDPGQLAAMPEDLRARLDLRFGDITDPFLAADLVAGCDVVLHLAALIGIPYSYVAPASYVATNVSGTLNVLEACRVAGTRRVIVTSTSEVYGSARYTPMDEEHPLQGQSPYSASKIAADKFAEAFHRSFDLPVVILRPFNTYGPRQSARAIIPTVLTQALGGASEIKLGSLTPRRDLTYVADTARAFFLAATTSGIEGETIHFGQGTAVAIADVAKACLAAVGSTGRITSVDARKRPDKSEVDHLLCNAAKAHRLLGWTPRVGLEEGIRLTAEHLKREAAGVEPGRYAI